MEIRSNKLFASLCVLAFFLSVIITNAQETKPAVISDTTKTLVQNNTKGIQVFKLIKVFKKKDSITAPDFIWKQGKKNVKFSEATKGKFVLLHFWTAWSEPCQAQAPEMAEVAKYIEEKGGLYISVALPKGWDSTAIETGLKEARKFCKSKNLTFPVVFGNQEIVLAIGGLMGVPTAFCIDNKGKLYSSVFGKQPKEEYIKAIDAMLNANK